jgi:hypothetical protein
MSTTDANLRPDIPPNPIPPKPPKVPTYSGQILPKYLVLTQVCAPPGASTGGTDSSVSYSSQSTTGTIDSVSSSFKAGVTVGANISAGLGVNASFGVSVTAGSTSQLTVTKSETVDIAVTGPHSDGINHDYDVVYLLMNPVLDVTVIGNDVDWTLGVSGTTAIIQYVLVEWLQTPSLMPSSVYQLLVTDAGMTQDDFDAILALNPFAADNTATPPSPRYVPTQFSFPYEPAAQGASVPTITYTLTSATTTSTTDTMSVEYTLSCTLTEGLDVEDVTDKFSEAATLTLTETSTATATTGSTQVATLTIGGPSSSYPGSTVLLAYLDTLYNTFVFAFPPAGEDPLVSGTVSSTSGSVAGLPISMEIGGVTLHSFTSPTGVYSFYGTGIPDPTGPATITVASQSVPVTIAANTPVVKPITL